MATNNKVPATFKSAGEYNAFLVNSVLGYSKFEKLGTREVRRILSCKTSLDIDMEKLFKAPFVGVDAQIYRVVYYQHKANNFVPSELGDGSETRLRNWDELRH